MTETSYLFGYPKEKYYEVKFPQIAYDRVEDGEALLRELMLQTTYDPKLQDDLQVALAIRIRKVQDAISTWNKILEIEEN